jgi:hypothetical protein
VTRNDRGRAPRERPTRKETNQQVGRCQRSACDTPTTAVPEVVAVTGQREHPSAVLLRLLDERLAAAGKRAAVVISRARDWGEQGRRPSHAELMRRRYPPTGDVQLWVRYGPAGPPEGRQS